jgi:hypothetical protein
MTGQERLNAFYNWLCLHHERATKLVHHNENYYRKCRYYSDQISRITPYERIGYIDRGLAQMPSELF